MKFRKTLKFMVQNPSPIFLYFLICWILFSALGTIADDPFQYGTLPEAGEEVKDSIKNLPWSVWKLFTALSHMIQEIARDFQHVDFWFLIIPALIIGYLEAKGSINGINKEHQVWMNWYERQQKAEELEENYEGPPSDDNDQVKSYFIKAHETILYRLRSPIRLFVHFGYWITFFIFVTIIMKTNNGIVSAMQNIMSSLPQFVIPAVILSLISSYRETRGFLKGVVAQRRIWTEWSDRQRTAKTDAGNFEEPPSSEKVWVESYFKTAIETVIFMLRNPKQFFIHFLSWGIGVPLLFIILMELWIGLSEGFGHFPSILDFTLFFSQFAIPAAVLAFCISYREARGNLKGIASEQQVWNRWYAQQQTLQNETDFEELPSSKNMQPDSYFMTAKRTVLSMLRTPLQYFIHLICWIFGFVVVYGITDLFVIEGLPDFAQILLVMILAFISCYQEIKGNLNGANSQRQVWMDWYNRQQQSSEEEIKLIESPPMLEVF